MHFSLNRVTCLSALHLLEAQGPLGGKDGRNMSYSKYLVETALLDGTIPEKYPPVAIAISAVMLADSVFGTKSEVKWLRERAAIPKEALLRCFRELYRLAQEEGSHGLTAIKRKYMKEKFNKVSKIKIAPKH